MCLNLVKVTVPVYRLDPYATPSGKLKFWEVKVTQSTFDLRCGHGLTDAERVDGYRDVDVYGRPILCNEHVFSQI